MRDRSSQQSFPNSPVYRMRTEARQSATFALVILVDKRQWALTLLLLQKSQKRKHSPLPIAIFTVNSQ
jgi:hypothetical protein